MKLCTDCKFFKADWMHVGRYSQCYHPSFVSPVDGKQFSKFADMERHIGNCGPNARNFQPKDPSRTPNSH